MCVFGLILNVPFNREGGYILFLVRILLASTFVSVHYLLNLTSDFDQTCIDTLLGGGKELTGSW